jgi:hypothetical protein
VIEAQVKARTDLKALGKALAAKGDKDLTKRAYRAIGDAAKPVTREVPASARTTLPRAGGLGDWVARAPVKTNIRLGARSVSARITSRQSKAASGRIRRAAYAAHRGRKRATRAETQHLGKGEIDLNAINRGRIRHPTYGHRPWKLQSVTAGYFDKPMTGKFVRRAQIAISVQVDKFLREVKDAG